MRAATASLILSAMLLVQAGPVDAQDGADRTVPEQGGGRPETTSVAVGAGIRDVTYFTNDRDEALYQGDVILGPAARLASLAGGTPLLELDAAIQFGLGVRDVRLRWPGGVVRFMIAPGVTRKDRIYTAVNAWETVTEIDFQEIAEPGGNYVEFVNGDGCSSYVGMIGGRQILNLGDDCSTGNAIHEIGHALGLHHEQAREDRGTHVVILTNNIEQGREGNFRRDPLTFEDLSAYCHGSVMHYGKYAFSRQPGILKTIETIPPGIPIGQRTHIAQCDRDAVNTLYPPSTAAIGTGDGGSVATITEDQPKATFRGQLDLYPANCRQTGKCYLRNDITFIDPWNVGWKAPARNEFSPDTVESGMTDGASIPRWAQWAIGEPFDQEYLLAAVLHDHYCYKENRVRSWRQTHRMFYDALVALKVPPLKAKTMYSAVYLGGPKWIELVPGDKCGRNCIFEATSQSGGLVVDADKLWYYRGTRDDPETSVKFKSLKSAIEVAPELSLTDIEALANTLDQDDPFYKIGDEVVPSGSDDALFKQLE